MVMSTERPSVVERLDVNEVKDGLIVYDPDTDRVHYLNSTAAVVFMMCDGQHDAAAIASLMAAAFELDDLPLADVEKCLSELIYARLLE